MMNPPPPTNVGIPQPHQQQQQQNPLPPKPVLQDDAVRFQVELEFVQCLANPNYLNFLAQRDYFKQEEFINYLEYLQYWSTPPYVKYLRYPQALHMLKLLHKPNFRAELVNTPCGKFIEDQMLLHWQFYSRKRNRLQQNSMEALRNRQPHSNNNQVVVPSPQQQ